MSMLSKRKGKTGEREVAALIRDHTGWNAQRRVRQHDGDSDILGVPGWSIEVKLQAVPRLRQWWQQAASQADPNTTPLLCYRLPRKPWRFVWPLQPQHADVYELTVEGDVQAWAAVAREVLG